MEMTLPRLDIAAKNSLARVLVVWATSVWGMVNVSPSEWVTRTSSDVVVVVADGSSSSPTPTAAPSPPSCDSCSSSTGAGGVDWSVSISMMVTKK